MTIAEQLHHVARLFEKYPQLETAGVQRAGYEHGVMYVKVFTPEALKQAFPGVDAVEEVLGGTQILSLDIDEVSLVGSGSVAVSKREAVRT